MGEGNYEIVGQMQSWGVLSMGFHVVWQCVCSLGIRGPHSMGKLIHSGASFIRPREQAKFALRSKVAHVERIHVHCVQRFSWVGYAMKVC